MKDVLDIFLKYVLPFIAAYLINIVMNRFLSKEFLRGKIHLIFLKGIILAIVWAAAALTALSGIPAFEKTWETAIASSGIAAVVLGLAAQSTLANVFAGIALSASTSRPFDIGDRIKIDNYDPGFVENITLRHTVIKTYQNEIIYIPNSIAGSATIVNYTQEDSFSYPIRVQVAYGTDMDKAMTVMASAIYSHPKHYGARPTVLCKSCDDSGVTLQALVETKDFKDNPRACSECLVEIMRRFNEEGIEIPYNKLVVLKGEE
ncbi:MAG: mechanosensitive ion channel family protein [Butyrivibrio sp.]|uniref:mechanosensitive ion channel family protein n=1 Tax=Butyrivibrio sp. TaxID=28121 RepID=UPI001B45AC31|nr:mechanosensitive ion channel family protein [Butyrivibrio sp.]MBP3783260.1 mechanosensitive ion channel family protein [Butyrivibrio sp.]